jgi:hypothetical protein
MRDKIKLIINVVLVCVTVKRAIDELHREQQRKRRLARSASFRE